MWPTNCTYEEEWNRRVGNYMRHQGSTVTQRTLFWLLPSFVLGKSGGSMQRRVRTTFLPSIHLILSISL
jgi:hypothetical protein